MRCLLPDNQEKSILPHFHLLHVPLIVFINLKWGTLSNAFAKSKYIQSKGLPLSIASVTFAKNSNRFVKHDLPFVNPCWLPFINLKLFKWLAVNVTPRFADYRFGFAHSVWFARPYTDSLSLSLLSLSLSRSCKPKSNGNLQTCGLDEDEYLSG